MHSIVWRKIPIVFCLQQSIGFHIKGAYRRRVLINTVEPSFSDRFHHKQLIINSSTIMTSTISNCDNLPEMNGLKENISPMKSPKKLKLDDAMPILPMLQFAKLSEHAYAPTRGSKRAAGYDLYSAYDVDVPAHGKTLVKTDIQIAVPTGCYGRVAPRSGLAVKHFVDVGAGVVDEDYRGNLGVVLFNFGSENFTVKKGDRIAQLICEKIYLPELEEKEKLDDTARGAGGFGSTGQN